MFGGGFPQRLQADRSGGLSSVEYFNMEHFVASVRREYVEINQGRTPPAVNEYKLQTALFRRGKDILLDFKIHYYIRGGTH